MQKQKYVFYGSCAENRSPFVIKQKDVDLHHLGEEERTAFESLRSDIRKIVRKIREPLRSVSFL